jgi:hypothetical protein
VAELGLSIRKYYAYIKTQASHVVRSNHSKPLTASS